MQIVSKQLHNNKQDTKQY